MSRGAPRLLALAAAALLALPGLRAEETRAVTLTDAEADARVAATWSRRALLIDTSRHFIPVGEIVDEIIPRVAAHGLNTLHIHLTDGPGWRFESKAYPRLTAVGAWRVDKTDKPWNWSETEYWTPEHEAKGLKRYGGFYTAEDIRTIREAAEAAGLTVIPEMDIPGHSASMMMAYPETACPTNRDPRAWFKGRDVLCISSPETLRMIDTLIGELCELFPDSPIHIGCDEVPARTWDACPGCRDPQARIAFYNAVIGSVRRRGREVCAWNELGSTGADVSDVTLTCWLDDAVPRANDMACPYSHCYLDQEASQKRLPTWNPPRHVRGVQVNLWTEEMQTEAIRLDRIDRGLKSLRQALRAAVRADAANETK